MKAKIEISLKPFRTPNFVLTEELLPPVPVAPTAAPMGAPGMLRDESRDELPKYKLSELSPETLSDLCDKFREDIFEKAGKHQPIKDRNV